MASEPLRTIVQMLRARPLAEDASFEEMRQGFEQMVAAFPLPPGIASQDVEAAGVPCEWVTAPASDAARTLLYLHGGGYVAGSRSTHRGLVGRLADACAARALSVEYRLAPEHPHPAAVEDATAAYRWLLGRGADPRRIVVAGDSAGGGLSVATLVALRDAGDPLPAAGVCLSPWVDLEGLGESMTTKAKDDPMVQWDGLARMARAYLRDADARTPLAAPLHADLAGLPPLLVQVGTAETLLDDSTRLAGRARAAGVEVELEVWDDMIHVWHAFAGLLPEADQAIARIGEFVGKRIG